MEPSFVDVDELALLQREVRWAHVALAQRRELRFVRPGRLLEAVVVGLHFHRVEVLPAQHVEGLRFVLLVHAPQHHHLVPPAQHLVTRVDRPVPVLVEPRERPGRRDVQVGPHEGAPRRRDEPLQAVLLGGQEVDLDVLREVQLELREVLRERHVDQVQRLVARVDHHVLVQVIHYDDRPQLRVLAPPVLLAPREVAVVVGDRHRVPPLRLDELARLRAPPKVLELVVHQVPAPLHQVLPRPDVRVQVPRQTLHDHRHVGQLHATRHELQVHELHRRHLRQVHPNHPLDVVQRIPRRRPQARVRRRRRRRERGRRGKDIEHAWERHGV